MVKFKWARDTEAKLKEFGATNYKLKPFPGMDHTVSIEELQVSLAFIHECLSRSAAGKIKLEEMNTAQLKAAIAEAGLGEQAVGLLEKQELVDLLRQAQEKDEL